MAVYLAENKSKDVTYRSDYTKVEGSKPQARSVSFQKVTYGGINGPYYSATTTQRTGSDGVNCLSSLSLVESICWWFLSSLMLLFGIRWC